MDLVFILLILLISFAISLTFSPQKAYLNLYLPLLFLTPVSLQVKLNPLPPISIGEAALWPIILFTLIYRFHRWKFTFTDLLVLCFTLSGFVAELFIGDFSTAQNLLIKDFTYVFFSYLVAKLIIIPHSLSVSIAKRIVVFGLINSITMFYEAIVHRNFQNQIFYRIFGYVAGWSVGIRYGIQRTLGPYTHPIGAGLALALTYLFHRWLKLNQFYNKNDFLFKLSRNHIIGIILVMALISTVSRAPIIGCVIGILILSFNDAVHKWKGLVIKSLGIIIITLLGFYIIRINEETETKMITGDYFAASISYRIQLLSTYQDAVLETPFWGHGLLNIPKLGGQDSIDNFYLYLALWHGLVPLFFFVCVQLQILIKLAQLFYRTKQKDEKKVSILMLSTLVTFSFVIATVSMDPQIIQIFFMLIGWSEGLLVRKSTIPLIQDSDLKIRSES